MSIEFACPYCDEISSVPDSFAGQQGKCPSCQKVIEVPDPQGQPAPTAPPPAAESQATVPPPRSADPAVTVPPPGPSKPSKPASAERDCPFCGETIKTLAKKCRYCGEFLEKGASRRTGGMPPTHMLMACLSTFFCCMPLGVVAIIFAAQVSSKFNSGDVRGAQKASANAKTFGMVSVGVMILFYGIAFVLALFA